MRLGVDYYPEHWKKSRFETDARLMTLAGISVIRLSEFAWSLLEPKEDIFDFSWLDEAIDVFKNYNIDIVLCTPTATPPKWLIDRYDDVLQRDKFGNVRGFGGRRHYCPNSKNYRERTQIIVEKMAEHYAGNSSVIGWQIDNEFGNENSARCYCENCRKAFANRLETKFGTVEKLNKAYGTVVWSSIYDTFDQINVPVASQCEDSCSETRGLNPSLLLEYYRFASDSMVDYQNFQFELLKKFSDVPITTNFMGTFQQINYFDLAEKLDFVAWDNYIDTQWGVGAPHSVALGHSLMRMVDRLNESEIIPNEIVWKPTVTTPDQITETIEQANFDKECAGIITFMHTFSPSKMWIAGLTRLNKPYCHFHTQFGREIPWESIDMDFMNLYQSAHGDREHGFIGARLRMARKVVVGYWENEETQKGIADFMRAAVGVYACKNLKVARFGDNMREVAVTEGDKVEAQIKLGWAVNYHPIGDVVTYVNAVSEQEIEARYDEVISLYTLSTDNIESVKYQIKMEIGMRKFLKEGNFKAFTTNFEDLHGLKQLPGLASQLLMADGYGFGGEGDWKASALTAVMKSMSQGMNGGTSFMEDYTYHLPQDNEMILGAHMLEVCPTISAGKPEIKVQPLGIGKKEPPARLTFDGAQGDAICVSLIDMGGRMRMIVQDVQAVAPLKSMPKLPVAGVMWKPLPNLQTAAEAWILAGGSHHTVMSYALTAQNMRDFAEMIDIEFVHISEKTEISELKKELLWNDIAYKIKM